MELLITITIMGILAIAVLNFDFHKQTDDEKRDRFMTTISSIMQSNRVAMISGKGINIAGNIINPTSIRLVFSSGAVITNYYSGTTIV